MPKNKKKTHNDELPGEGRPPELTLGCFFKEAKPKRRPTALVDATAKQAKSNETGDIETELGYEPPKIHLQAVPSFPLLGHTSSAGLGHDFSSQDETSSSSKEDKSTTPSFKIMRTKKGGFPIYLEKRAKGKKVTVLRQVTGESKTLLQILKTKFGTGGLLKPGEVEIQGDFETKLLKYLQENRSYMVPYKS